MNERSSEWMKAKEKLWICKLKVIKRIFIFVHILHPKCWCLFSSLLRNHVIATLCYLLCPANCLLYVWSINHRTWSPFRTLFFHLFLFSYEFSEWNEICGWKEGGTSLEVMRASKWERKDINKSHNSFSIETLLDTYFASHILSVLHPHSHINSICHLPMNNSDFLFYIWILFVYVSSHPWILKLFVFAWGTDLFSHQHSLLLTI